MTDAALATPAAPPAAGSETIPPATTSPATTGAAPPSQDGKTLIQSVDTTGDGEGQGGAPATWPENWRDIASGGDQKTSQYLSRYASPANVVKALMATRQKMSAGDLIRAKPEGDPNDPQVKQALQEWRAQAGVPESPDGYLDKVPGGLVFGDADKPVVENFLKDMHAADAPPAYVHKALQWYKAHEQNVLEERAGKDAEFRATAEDDLRAEYGPEYRANLANAHSLFSTYGTPELADKIFAARDLNGRLLGDDPTVTKFLVNLAREMNPHGTVPGADSAQGQKMASEMDAIRKAMADQNSDYWRGPRDANGNTTMQRRFAELTEIQMRRKG